MGATINSPKHRLDEKSVKSLNPIIIPIHGQPDGELDSIMQHIKDQETRKNQHLSASALKNFEIILKKGKKSSRPDSSSTSHNKSIDKNVSSLTSEKSNFYHSEGFNANIP